jgi:hypothetical protein
MIDINYRPSTYFRPQKLEEYLLSKVKGAVLKRKLKALFSEGRHKDAADLIGEAKQAGKALESIHPMFMGGNYLCIPVMLPTGSSDCDPPVLEVLPSHSSGCDPLRRRSCPIPKACRCVIART